MVWDETTEHIGTFVHVVDQQLNTVMCFSQQLHWTRRVTQISSIHYWPGGYRNNTATTDGLPEYKAELTTYSLKTGAHCVHFDH